ncbi:MAG: hypothetical protein AMXMBFR7_49210 [Planctomycetota bacterium]
MEASDERSWVNKSDLKSIYGMSDKWIKELGRPDAYGPQPRSRWRSPAHLYDLKRVEAFVELHLTEMDSARECRSPGEIERERFARFARKYKDWRRALPDAVHAMQNMNRYVKRRQCRKSQRTEVYELKNRLIQFLYEEAYTCSVVRHVITSGGLDCRRCAGSGKEGWSSRDWGGDVADHPCPFCGGTGWYRAPSDRMYVCFEFKVGEQTYGWHQPEDSLTFEYKLTSTDPPKSIVLDMERPLDMKPSQFAQAKALVRWVLSKEAPNPPRKEE